MLIRHGNSGDEDRAAELLKAAADSYEELRMTSWQENAEADIASIAGSPRAS